MVMISRKYLFLQVSRLSPTSKMQEALDIKLYTVCASANSGVPDYETNGHLTITDTDG